MVNRNTRHVIYESRKDYVKRKRREEKEYAKGFPFRKKVHLIVTGIVFIFMMWIGYASGTFNHGDPFIYILISAFISLFISTPLVAVYFAILRKNNESHF